MVDHPLTPDEVKKYIEAQNLEKVVNAGINNVLRERPQDALSSLAVFLTECANKIPILDHLEAAPTIFTSKFKPTLAVKVFLNYEGRVKCRHEHVFTYNPGEQDNLQLDGEEGSMKSAIDLINGEVNDLLKGSDLTALKKVDNVLLKWYNDKTAVPVVEGEGEEVKEPVEGEAEVTKIGLNVIKAVSEALVYAVAKAQGGENPYLSHYKTMTGHDFNPATQGPNLTKLMFTILNGGENGSKVKFSKIYLIINAKAGDSILELYQAIQI